MPRKANQPNLREKAYNEIRSRILTGQYSPSTLLSEYKLAEELQISRTPIREALRDLSKSGLVEILPQRGIIVKHPSAKDIMEIYQIRELLEGYAAKAAAENARSGEIERIKATHAKCLTAAKAGRKRQAYDYAVQMHHEILKLCNNSRIIEHMMMLDDQVHLLGLVTLGAEGRLSHALEEHDRIIAAIASGNGEVAQNEMTAHLREDRDTAVKALMPVGIG